MLSAPVVFPSFLQRKLEDTVRRYLEPVESNYRVDFLRPAGEPALTSPDSVSWQIFKNPIALFIGGVTAVILELAEPRVREGVWQNTNFKSNPLLRLKRTGLAAMVTVYGPHHQSEAMIAGVRKIHDRISGITPCGQTFHANEPELLEWVHATASFGFLQAYSRYVRPLHIDERNRYYAEGMTSAALFGALGAPSSEREVIQHLESMHDKLEASPIIFDFLNVMHHASLLPLPRSFHGIQKLLVMAAIDLVPHRIREKLGLIEAWPIKSWQIHATRRMAAAADRVLIRSLPSVQACLRMGLPENYLYH